MVSSSVDRVELEMSPTAGEYLQARDYLGLSLNCTIPVDPLNPCALAAQSVGNFCFQPTPQTRPAKVSSRAFATPLNVYLRSNLQSSNSKLEIYRSGSEMLEAVQSDSSISCDFMWLAKASGSLHIAYQRYRKADRQYALYSHQTTLYRATIPTTELLKNIEATYKETALSLPTWDSTFQEVVDAYVAYFNTFGTHVVTEVDYGWRYQLTIGCASKRTDTAQFKANVNEQFKGILTNSHITSLPHNDSEQYKHYLASSDITCHVLGGSTKLAFEASRVPDDRDAYSDWLRSALSDCSEAPINMKAHSLAQLYQTSNNTGLKRAGQNLESAFKYISTLGTTATRRRLQVRLWKDSDWGAVEFISGNCSVEVPDVQPDDVREMTSRKVCLGRAIRRDEVSHVDFDVLWDGNCGIDVAISHGTDGSRGRGHGMAGIRLGAGDMVINSAVVPHDGGNTMTFRGLKGN